MAPKDRKSRAESRRKDAQATVDAALATERLAKGTEKEAAAKTALIKANISLLESQRALSILNKESKEDIDNITKSINNATKSLEDHTDKLEAAKKAQEDYNKAAANAEDQFDNLITGLTGINDQWDKSLIGSLAAQGGIEGFTRSIKKLINPVNIAGSILRGMEETTIELAKATDSASVEFNKTTGMAREFRGEIEGLEPALRSDGILIGDLYDAYGDLATTYSEFTELTKVQRVEIGTNLAILDKFGVSAQEAGVNQEFMTRTMGMNGVAASKTQIALFQLAQEHHISTQRMSADFQSNQGTLSKFGDKAVEVYADLAIAAKASGMEVSALLDIVEQFDRFDSAAKSVGQLNALLGGPFLNSLEMVTATDPIERLQMLQGALTDAGKDFDSMTYYEKQAIAAGMGLKDVGELARLMRGDFAGMSGGMDLTAAQFEEMQKQSTDFNSVMDEIKQVMMQFAISMGPVVRGFKDMLDWIQKLLGNDGIRYLVLVVAGFIMLLKLLYGGMKLAAISQVAFGSATSGSAGAIAAQAAALRASIPVLVKAIPVIAALGKAALMLGFSVLMAAGGIALLFYSLSLVSPSQLMAGAAAMAAMALSIWAISLALAPLIGLVATGGGAAAFWIVIAGLAALGAIFSLIAFSAALFAEAMAHVFESMKGAGLGTIASDLVAINKELASVPKTGTVLLTALFANAAAFKAVSAIGSATSPVATSGGGGAAAAAGNIVVQGNLMINDRTLGPYIFDKIEEFEKGKAK